MRGKPILAQIETQALVTLALLPAVAALPVFSDEALARTFGQAMALRNWTQTISAAMPMFLTVLEAKVERPSPLTQAEQREYWRLRKREERARELLKLETTKGKDNEASLQS